MVRGMVQSDINGCVAILIAAYNCEPWNNNWTETSAERYLNEFFDSNHFIGYVAVDGDRLVGAVFAHRRTWWTNDEVYIDEIFIKPDAQGKGFGTELLSRIEDYSRSEKLGGVTLLTNRFLPAAGFYKEKGYSEAGHVVFMYKEIWR